MLGVVLAAGRGVRLGPLTTDRSKPMLPVAGKPMIERVLEMLAAGGVEHVIAVVHPGDIALHNHLVHSPWAPKCRFAYQKHRRGMAHAVECASPLVRGAAVSEFVLASCDNLYPRDHVSGLIAHRRSRLDAALTLTWTSREEATASAVVVRRGPLVVDILEKPDPEDIPVYEERGLVLAAPSLYALSTRVLDYLDQVPVSPRGECEFPDALRLLIADGGRVGGVLVSDRMTLTNPRDLLALNLHFLRTQPHCAVVETDIDDGVTVVPPVRIEEDVYVAPGCRVGPLAYLERGCRLCAGAEVRRSVVLRRGLVGPNQVIEGTVIGGMGAAF